MKSSSPFFFSFPWVISHLIHIKDFLRTAQIRSWPCYLKQGGPQIQGKLTQVHLMGSGELVGAMCPCLYLPPGSSLQGGPGWASSEPWHTMPSKFQCKKCPDLWRIFIRVYLSTEDSGGKQGLKCSSVAQCHHINRITAALCEFCLDSIIGTALLLLTVYGKEAKQRSILHPFS